MAAHIFLFYISYIEDVYQWPHLLGIITTLPLLQSVFLYYYVSSVTNQFPKKNWVAMLHLIPAISGNIYLIPFYMLSAQEKITVFESNGKGHEAFLIVGLILIYISGIIYVIWSGILLSKHKKNIRNQFSDIEEIELKWLQFLTYGIGAIWCIVIFTNNDLYIFSGVSVFVILIGFFGVQQRAIFTSRLIHLIKPSIEKKIMSNADKKKKYSTSGLTETVGEDLYKNLIQLITVEAYYKKPNLSLNNLASELNIHPNYLSQIINDKEGKNFYNFVNAFRVEEFKRIAVLPENKRFTLLSLAYDCGFNSKSSFNRYFKKHTCQTPSEYFKSILK